MSIAAPIDRLACHVEDAVSAAPRPAGAEDEMAFAAA